MHFPEITVVAAIIYNSENRVLITQRPEGFHLAGLWEFPGGKVRSDEDFSTALRRELHEELGLKVSAVGKTIASVADVGSDFMIHFIHTLVEGKVRLNETLCCTVGRGL